MRVGIWLDYMGPRARRGAELVSLGFAACFTAYMLWAISFYVYGGWQDGYLTQGLLIIPEWIPQMSLVFGMLILLIAILDELVAVLKKQKPSYQLQEEARRAAGDFSETV